MAKLRAPLFSLSANKTFGKTMTFQERQSGSAVYLKSEPGAVSSFTPSYKQRDQRAIRGLLMAQWQCMTPAEKLVWENEALAFGDSLSGNHYFLKKAQTNLYLYHGLAGYWSFNDGPSETVRDLSGNGNTGTLKPTYPADAPTFVDSVNPKFGDALNFDGANDYVNVTHTAALAITGDLAISAWIWVPDYSQYNFILAKQQALISNNQYELRIDKTTGKLCFTEASSAGTPNVISTIAVGINAWHHVAAVRLSSNAYLYIDGIPRGSGDVGSNPTGAGDLKIGTRSDYYTYFLGKIDDVRIYNRVLSASEILKHYQLLRR